jgi:putative nucleotidyltransferase with HDIG domain
MRTRIRSGIEGRSVRDTLVLYLQGLAVVAIVSVPVIHAGHIDPLTTILATTAVVVFLQIYYAFRETGHEASVSLPSLVSTATHRAKAAYERIHEPLSNHYRRRYLAWRVWSVCIFAAGALAICGSGFELYLRPPDWAWLAVVILVVLHVIVVARSASQTSFSLRQTFASTAVVLFGVGAGVVLVTIETLANALSRPHSRQPRAEQIVLNVAIPVVATYAGAFAIDGTSGLITAVLASHGLLAVTASLTLFAATSFVLTAAMTSVTIALLKGESARAVLRSRLLRLWRDFAWNAALTCALALCYGTRSWTIALMLAVVVLIHGADRLFAGKAQRHLDETNAIYVATVQSLAAVIDAKDSVLHAHTRRVQQYASEIATALGVKSDTELKAIQAAALLHDLGKIAVPNAILNKPGPLTAEEGAIVRQHATVGADIIRSIRWPYPVEPIVRHHHERWDGSGYPAGLAGTDIPLGARILAIVEAFDTLTSDKPYGTRLTEDDALAVIAEGSGSFYDPFVLDAFVKIRTTPSTIKDASAVESERIYADVSAFLTDWLVENNLA